MRLFVALGVGEESANSADSIAPRKDRSDRRSPCLHVKNASCPKKVKRFHQDAHRSVSTLGGTSQVGLLDNDSQPPELHKELKLTQPGRQRGQELAGTAPENLICQHLTCNVKMYFVSSMRSLPTIKPRNVKVILSRNDFS